MISEDVRRAVHRAFGGVVALRAASGGAGSAASAARAADAADAVLAALEKAGYTVTARGQHHEGPLHPECVRGDNHQHLVTVDGEIIGGPWPAVSS